MHSRRNALRTKINMSAQLVTSDGRVVRTGQLRDLSARGAKLVLPNSAELPEQVILHLPLDGVMWPCRIVRRRDGEVGVLFV